MIDPSTLPLYAQLKAAIIDSIRNGSLLYVGGAAPARVAVSR